MTSPRVRETKNPQGVIIAYVLSAADRAAVIEGAADTNRPHFCVSAQEAATALLDPAATGVVVEIHGDSARDLAAIVEALGRRSVPVPLLLRFELGHGAILQMLKHAEHVLDLRVSLRRADSLSQGVARLRSPIEEEASRIAIISRVGKLVPHDALEIVFGATIIGERHASVQDLANLCGRSVRYVEDCLQSAHLLEAKHILMWSLSLHSLWRVTRLGWAVKHAASAAGFRSADDLSRVVKRTVGRRLAQLARESSFAELLERYERSVIRPPREYLLRP